MNPKEIEELFIRSFDQPLSDTEKEQMLNAMHSNTGLAKDMSEYKRIREALLRKQPATFGPYFAQKVITRIQGLRIEIDKQIVFFFKKFQLAAAGVLVALLAVNVIFSDQLNVSSVLGLQDSVATVTQPVTDNQDTVTNDVDVVSFDFFDNLTDNAK